MISITHRPCESTQRCSSPLPWRRLHPWRWADCGLWLRCLKHTSVGHVFCPRYRLSANTGGRFPVHFKMLLPLTRTLSSASPSCLPTSLFRVTVRAVTWRSSSSATYLTMAPNWVSRPRNTHGSDRPGVMQARPYLILRSCTRCHNMPQTSSQTTAS